LYFPRFAFVHIASIPSSNQINGMESQTIHIIQLLCGPTLSEPAHQSRSRKSGNCHLFVCVAEIRARCPMAETVRTNLFGPHFKFCFILRPACDPTSCLWPVGSAFQHRLVQPSDNSKANSISIDNPRASIRDRSSNVVSVI